MFLSGWSWPQGCSGQKFVLQDIRAEVGNCPEHFCARISLKETWHHHGTVSFAHDREGFFQILNPAHGPRFSEPYFRGTIVASKSGTCLLVGNSWNLLGTIWMGTQVWGCNLRHKKTVFWDSQVMHANDLGLTHDLWQWFGRVMTWVNIHVGMLATLFYICLSCGYACDCFIYLFCSFCNATRI